MTITEIFDTMSYGPAPESPAAAHAWLDAHDRTFKLFINGEWVPAQSGATLETVRPDTGDLLATVADAGPADIDAAYEAARAAQPAWRDTPDHQRARLLYAISRGVQKHQRLLAVVESMDNGKPIRESRDIDILLVARHFYHHAGWAQLMATEFPDHEAVGVIGQIIPWNFPLLMMAWKIAPALAMGNTVVIKPAPFTPLSALLLAEIAHEAGLPPGVLNVVTGGDAAGEAITAHPGFDKIAFTGSTEVGRIIRRATAGTGKKLSLELGGKSPFVIFDDCDQDAAIEGLVDAIWFNQGQVCCAGSRMLVQETIWEGFIAKLRRRMDQLRVGPALDKAVDIGAVVAPVQQQRIEGWVQRGIEDGASIYQPACDFPPGGTFFPPTLITDVSPASAVVQEEIFGPVLVGMSFRTPDEAIALANNTRYGLAASVWSENINLALDVASKIKAGVVWVNSTNLFDAASGFGGYRESGYGREGGREGLFEYLTPSGKTPYKGEAPAPAPDWGSHTPRAPLGGPGTAEGIDRTAKMYIGGKQARPDGNYSYPVTGPGGTLLGMAGDGNRKDVRNAVEAAHKAKGWAHRTPHNRAQILYYMAENLAARRDEFAARLTAMTGEDGAAEVEANLQRLFTYAAYADKFGGTVQETTLYGLVTAVNEPVGVIGIACPTAAPLLGFISLMAAAIARGNTTVIIPSESHPLAATDFYQVLDTSDLPGGVVNIVTGNRDHLTATLAAHEDVDAMWYVGPLQGSAEVERLSAVNMKQTWVTYGQPLDWRDEAQARAMLRRATQVKNIWVPMGE